jgi:hypothetical protein
MLTQRFAPAPRRLIDRLAPLALMIAATIWSAVAPLAQAYPIDSVFTITQATSTLKIKATSSPFSDDDTKNLTGSLNVTLDFGASGFDSPARFTVNSGTVTPTGNYSLTLGFPPILGVRAVTSNLAAQISTPSPPGTMIRSAAPGVVYQIDSSQFKVAINQGTVVVTGTANETIDFAQDPVEGTSPAGTLGTLTLATGVTSGYYTLVNAALSLPVDVSETADLGGLSVDMQVTGTVNATSSFYAALNGIPGDFQLDGDVDGADLPLWKTGFGLATGAMPSHGDANADGGVDGADFLMWQRNYGVQPPAVAVSAIAAVPEPGTVGMCVVALGAVVTGRRLSAMVR